MPFVLGAWQTNCFLLAQFDGEGSPCWMIDVGFEPEPMFEAVEEKGWVLEKIVLTHAHVDHIAGLNAARERFAGVPVAIHEAEQAFLGRPELNLSAALPEQIVCEAAEETLVDGQVLTLGGEAGLAFEVRHVPGHSPGGVALYQSASEIAIVGDALFAGSIGRHDFPTSDGELLLKKIAERLLTLPDATRIFPGHGPDSTIRQERATNPYVGAGAGGLSFG
ncbi:MBL fold metallo-hydrolase [Mucisphaera sp.]|uniref:MBL fold metallo-hydrolase n=1 Tax=Mucisphaera sp. TaxID=2913024 RepID=UPI003D0B99A4